MKITDCPFKQIKKKKTKRNLYYGQVFLTFLNHGEVNIKWVNELFM